MATHSSTLAGESHGQRSLAGTRVRHDLPTKPPPGDTLGLSSVSALTVFYQCPHCLGEWASVCPQHLEAAGTLGSTSALLLGSMPWSISAPEAEVATSWLPWLLTNAFKQVSLVIYLAVK